MTSCIWDLARVEWCLEERRWPPLCNYEQRWDKGYTGFAWREAPGGHDYWDEEVRPGEPISEQAQIYLRTIIYAHKLGV